MAAPRPQLTVSPAPRPCPTPPTCTVASARSTSNSMNVLRSALKSKPYASSCSPPEPWCSAVFHASADGVSRRGVGRGCEWAWWQTAPGVWTAGHRGHRPGHSPVHMTTRVARTQQPRLHPQSHRTGAGVAVGAGAGGTPPRAATPEEGRWRDDDTGGARDGGGGQGGRLSMIADVGAPFPGTRCGPPLVTPSCLCPFRTAQQACRNGTGIQCNAGEQILQTLHCTTPQRTTRASDTPPFTGCKLKY